MTARRHIVFALVVLVVFGLPLGAAATPDLSGPTSLQPCSPSLIYDPACDVDHDGDVDIFDIQLTASHWNQSGVWTGGDFWSLLGNVGTNPAVNYLGTRDNQALVVRTNNTERMRVTNNGLVGIGTASPSDQLSVRNTGTGRAGFFQTDNAANNAAALSAVVQAGNGSAVFANIVQASNGAPSLYATTQGTGPAARLEGLTQVWGGQLQARDANHQVAVIDSDNANKTWTLTSHQDTSGIGFWENGATGRFVVASGGNVGIGTLAPQTPLHVNQSAETGTDIYVTSPEFARMRMVAEAPNPDVTLSIQARGESTTALAEIGTLSRHELRFYTNEMYRMTLDTNGNVGIGTTGPGARLHVQGSNDGTDILVTDGEFARMRMEATDPANDVVLSVQARGSATVQRAEIGTVTNHDVVLYTNTVPHMVVNTAGNVGIGTMTPNPLYRLSVNGGVRAKEVVVETGWSDFVFEEGYQLMSLADVEAFISQHGHLPDIPSAAEVAANGVSLGEMDARLLQKIEELTLHLIALEKRLGHVEAENQVLRAAAHNACMAPARAGGQ